MRFDYGWGSSSSNASISRRLSCLWGIVGIVVLAGCGPGGPVKYSVSGTVKVDATPLPTGHITLMPADGVGTPDAGTITDGKFSFLASPGKKRVEITATREKGGVDPAMGQALREEYIGPEYNVESKLQAEVTPSGPNQYEFVVTEKK